MPLLLLKDVPRYECLLEAAKIFPALDPSACEAFLYLLRTGDEAFRVTDENLGRHHISQGRFGVLLHLIDKAHACPKAHTPAELAELCGVTRATMTGLIDTLERDALVIREPDPTDRRMMSIKLTPKGIELLDRVMPEHFRRITSIMACLTEAERKTLVSLLIKVLDRASSIGPDGEPLPQPPAV